MRQDFPGHYTNSHKAASKAVELIRNGIGDFLMKGKLETIELLRPVVNKETGFGTDRLMSHCTVSKAPYYHKLFAAVEKVNAGNNGSSKTGRIICSSQNY